MYVSPPSPLPAVMHVFMAFDTCASYVALLPLIVLPPVGTRYTFVVGPIRTYGAPATAVCTYKYAYLFLLPFARVDVLTV